MTREKFNPRDGDRVGRFPSGSQLQPLIYKVHRAVLLARDALSWKRFLLRRASNVAQKAIKTSRTLYWRTSNGNFACRDFVPPLKTRYQHGTRGHRGVNFVERGRERKNDCLQVKAVPRFYIYLWRFYPRNRLIVVLAFLRTNTFVATDDEHDIKIVM